MCQHWGSLISRPAQWSANTGAVRLIIAVVTPLRSRQENRVPHAIRLGTAGRPGIEVGQAVEGVDRRRNVRIVQDLVATRQLRRQQRTLATISRAANSSSTRTIILH